MFSKDLKNYLALMGVLFGMFFTVNTPVYASENTNHANTEVSINLTRKIVPMEEGSGKNNISGNNTSNQANDGQDTKKDTTKLLPQTGVTVGHLSILGGILVMMSLLILIFKKCRRED